MNESIVRISVDELIRKSAEKPANYLQTIFRLSHVGTQVLMPKSCYDFATNLFSTQVDATTVEASTDTFIQELVAQTPMEKAIKRPSKYVPELNELERAFFSSNDSAQIPEYLVSLRKEYLKELNDPGCVGCKKNSLIQKYKTKMSQLAV